jgi:predicted ATPase
MPVAHFGWGTILMHTGALGRALASLEHARALYAPQYHDTHVAQHGVDCGVFAQAYASHTLWLLGYPAQALARGQAAWALARQAAHPFSIVLSLAYLAMLEQFCGMRPAAGAHAAAAIALATEHGFPYYLAWGQVLQAWARVQGTQHAPDITAMRQSLAALEGTGARLRRPYYVSLLAQAWGQAGQVEGACVLLDEALAETQHTHEQWWDAEVHRLRGHLCAQQEAADASQAEASLHQALAVARRQQAKALELRAAMSLSRLWQRQGKQAEARELLTPLYSWFTEGFDTADLQEAKALLEELGG